MKFQVTFNDEETALVQQYMQDTGLTISKVVLCALLERIFDNDAKYRIVFDIKDEKIVILVVDVDKRNEIYK